MRRHHLANGSVFDRRKVQELILEAISGLADLQPDAFEDGAFKNTDLKVDALEEYYSSGASSNISFKVQRWSGLLVPESLITMDGGDSYTAAHLSWTIEIQIDTAAAQFIAAWPTVGGTSAWAGLSFHGVDQERTYVAGAVPPNDITSGLEFPVGEKFCMSGECRCSVDGGTLTAGLVILAETQFTINKVNVIARKVLR